MTLEQSKKTKKIRLKKPLVLALVFTLIFNSNFRTKIDIKQAPIIEQIASQNNKYTSFSFFFFLDTDFPANLCDFLYFFHLSKPLGSFFIILFQMSRKFNKISAQNSQWPIPSNLYKFVCSSCQYQRFQPRNQEWCLCCLRLGQLQFVFGYAQLS